MKPTCPDHPTASMVDARKPASDERMWMCLVCGRQLGPAPAREAEWETFRMDSDEVGELPDG